LTYQFGFGVVLAAALSMSSGQSWFRQSPPLAILLGILYGAALVAIAFGLEWAFKRVSYQVGTQILSTEIVFAVILGSLLYSEVPNPASSIGGVLILCGALLAAFNTRSSENAFFKNL
jgi:drug/metabolite transporter (DMT)-like permease